MFKIVILAFVIFIGTIKADLVSFNSEGYVSTYAAQNLKPKSSYSKIGKYHLYVSYNILAKWKTGFLMQDPLTYADFIYQITNVSIYVSDTSSRYSLLGASTTQPNSKQIFFNGNKNGNFLKSLVRIFTNFIIKTD